MAYIYLNKETKEARIFGSITALCNATEIKPDNLYTKLSRKKIKEFKTTTTNTMAIDAAFDDCYDDEDNSDRYYKSRQESQEALVNEILNDNLIEIY